MTERPGTAVGRGIWVYPVAAMIRREWFGRADGIGGRPVWGIAGRGGAVGRLAAAVSGINLDELGQESLARMDRVGRDRIIWAHRPVVGIIADYLPVVPIPPSTAYPDEAAVVPMLAARLVELTAMLLNVAAFATSLDTLDWSPRIPAALLPASHVIRKAISTGH